MVLSPRSIKTQKEYQQWKQAKSLYFRIQSGQSIRYDPRSAVGKRINYYFKNRELAEESLRFTQRKMDEPVTPVTSIITQPTRKLTPQEEAKQKLLERAGFKTKPTVFEEKGYLPPTYAREGFGAYTYTPELSFQEQQKQDRLFTALTGEEIQREEKLKEIPRKETIQYVPTRKYDIKFQPYIERRITGVFQPEGTTRQIPTGELVYVDPTVYGEQLEREPTKEEKEYFEQIEKSRAYPISEKPISPIQKVEDTIRGEVQRLKDFEADVSERTVKPLKISEYAEKGVDIFIPVVPTIPGTEKLMKETAKGVIVDVIKDIEERPLQQLALVGIGGIVGAGAKGVGVVASKFGRVAGTSAKLGTVVVGAGLTGMYALDVGSKFVEAETVRQKSAVLGIAGKDIALLGYGFGKGQKAVTKFRGWLATRGRIEILVEKLVPKDVLIGKETFPTAPSKKHLELFLGKKYRLPDAEKPIMYHTTPSKFWKKDIVVDVGESELKGLYGAYGISPHFLKVSGKEYKLFPRFKELITPEGLPAVAEITPKKFRISKAYKEAGEWKLPKKTIKGVADIPLMKTEVEAVLPPETKLLKKPKAEKYFFEWKDIKIPIDRFEVPEITKAKVKAPKGKPKIKTMKEISKSYGEIPSYAYLSPELGYAYRPSRKPSRVSKVSYPKDISKVVSKVSKPSFIKSFVSRIPKLKSYKIPSHIYKPYISPPDIPYEYIEKPRRRKYPTALKMPKLKGVVKDILDTKKFTEDIAVLEGFTSKQLELPARTIDIKDIEKSALREAIGIRKAPIIVSRKIKKRRK